MAKHTVTAKEEFFDAKGQTQRYKGDKWEVLTHEARAYGNKVSWDEPKAEKEPKKAEPKAENKK